MTTTRECGHCCQDNPADTATCTFCTEPLDSPDPIQEADLTNPPTTHREEPAMGSFTRESNEEAAYRSGQDRADRAIREGKVAEHERLLTDLNAHPQTLRGFRDRTAQG